MKDVRAPQYTRTRTRTGTHDWASSVGHVAECGLDLRVLFVLRFGSGPSRSLFMIFQVRGIGTPTPLTCDPTRSTPDDVMTPHCAGAYGGQDHQP